MSEELELSENQPNLQTRLSGTLIDIDYKRITVGQEQYPEVILYLRDHYQERKTFCIRGFRPYIFAELEREELQKILHENQEFRNWFLKQEQLEKTSYETGDLVDLVRIYGNRPWEVPEIRDILDHFTVPYHEADIPFVHRFLIDNELFGLRELQIDQSNEHIPQFRYIDQNYKLKVLSLDIEIESHSRSESETESIASIMRTGSRRITAISCWAGINQNLGIGRSFILKKDDDQSEIKFLESSFHQIWTEFDPDIVVTYNGESFDFPYLVKRLERLGVSLKILSPNGLEPPRRSIYSRGWLIPGLLIFDLFRRTKWKYTSDGSKSLHSIAKEILGEGKNDPNLDHGGVWRKSLTDVDYRQQLAKYAEKDAELTYKLWFALEMPSWLEVIRITGVPPGEGMYYTERQAGEFLVFRNMYRHNILIPRLPSKEEREIRRKTRERTKGGLVLDPTRDITGDVLICDFTSMYPSLVVTHNIGMESFLGPKPDIRNRFRDSPQTSMAITQEQLLEQRKIVKLQIDDLEQNIPKGDELSDDLTSLRRSSWAIKILMNSLIGGYNFIGSRFHSSDLSNTVTGLGRQYIRDLEKETKNFDTNYEVIYGDTDSIFIETNLTNETHLLWDLPDGERTNFHKYIPNYLKLLEHLQATISNTMRLDLQDVALRILFHKGAKKRYTYISAITKKVIIIGFEAIRHDWSPLAREAQKEAINIILETGDLKLAKKKMIDYLRSQLKKTDEELLESVTILGAIRRDPKKYKNITPGISALLHYIEYHSLNPNTEWKKYDHFPYIIKEGSGPIRDRSFHPSFIRREEIDIGQYLEESLRAINRFNVEMTIEDVLGHQQTHLDDFFDK